MNFNPRFPGHPALVGLCTMMLAVLPLLVAASESPGTPAVDNGSFEQGTAEGRPASWEVGARALAVELDQSVSRGDGSALKVSGSAADGSAFVKQELDLGESGFSGATLRGHIRTQGIARSATLVAILEGPDGRIFMDDMRDRVVRGDTGWQEYSVYVPASKEARSLTIGALVIGAGTAWFDDLALGRTPEAASSDTDPREYVLEALSIMRENYLHADEVDWAQIRERGLGALSDNPNMAQTRAAVSMMVEALDDPHATTGGAPGSGNVEDEATEPVEHVDVEMVSEGIAMVRVPRVPGSTPEAARVRFADAAHRAMKSIDSPDLCGWVVDLRDNTGGNMWPMLAAIGPIAGPGVLGQFQGREGSEVVEWVYRYGAAGTATKSETVERTRASVSVEPFEPTNTGLPVAVLVSGRTASSGEATAIAFIGRDNTRLFGSETGGLATANNGYPMPDGLRIVFPIGYMADRHGNIHHPAVEPDEALAPADALDRAIAWLRHRPDCAR